MDSIHQLGLKVTLHRVLILVESGGTGKEAVACSLSSGGIFPPQKLPTSWGSTTSNAMHNGDNSWIQHIKEVQKHLSTEF